MPARNPHPEAIRIRAVTDALQLVNEGMSANQAAAQIAKPLGIAGRTLQTWAQQQGRNLGDTSHAASKRAREVQAAQFEARRAELRVLLLDKALDMLRRMDQPQIDFRGKDADKVTFPIANASDVRNFAVAAGVLIDKMRLEHGEPTSVIVTQSDELDAELRGLLADANEAARRRG